MSDKCVLKMDREDLSAVIIEDERKSLDLLKDLVESCKNVRVNGFTSDSEEAVSLILRLRPDVVFLDIKMPGKNGFDIIDELSQLRQEIPFIVFTTAYDEFAVRAFEYAAFDYLLKPIDPDRLASTLNRCMEIKQSGSTQKPELLKSVIKKLIYRTISGIVIVDPAEVVYVEATGNYSSFKFIDGRLETVTISLGKVQEQLPSDFFFRTGRTFIINLALLKKVNSKKRECVLHSNGREFKCDISHDKIKILLDQLRRRSG